MIAYFGDVFVLRDNTSSINSSISVSTALPYLSQPPAAVLLSDIFIYCFTFTSEHFRVSNLINHVTLCIKVQKKTSEWIWRFEAREGKKVKYVFANTTTQREKKLNPHANTPAAVKMSEINLKYENTRTIHRLLTY